MNQADTAWMLCSTALVLFMTPMLAFFYGGLVRSKNALNTMMMSFIALGFTGIIWAVVAYSLAFTTGNKWIGDLSNVFLKGVGLEPLGTIPHMLHMSYQATFAIITAALISGSIVERMRFSAYVTFISLWGIVVYAPIAHWVWGGGWLAQMGALDFAGGTVVHVNAAMAAVAVALALGKRREYPSSSLLPHSVPLTLLGAGGLWFGWFGFNSGSALASNGIAALAFTAVGPMDAIWLGGFAAIPSYLVLQWRAKTNFDDSLDVFAAHGIGGTVGALLTGVFAQKALNGVQDGLMYGNAGQLGIQAIAVAAAAVYSFVGSFILVKIVSFVIPLRPSAEDEMTGLDISQHGEEAYLHAESSNGMIS